MIHEIIAWMIVAAVLALLAIAGLAGKPKCSRCRCPHVECDDDGHLVCSHCKRKL